MPYYVHEFHVQMIVENVSDTEEAARWMRVRLNGGDASFEIEHTGSVDALSPADAEGFQQTGKHPSRKEGSK